MILPVCIAAALIPQLTAVTKLSRSGIRVPESTYGHADRSQLKVGFAVFLTDISSTGWRDGAYVLAHSIKLAAARSRHSIDLLALVPQTFTIEVERLLLDAGFKNVMRKGWPVHPEEVRGKVAHKEMVGTNGQDEYSFSQLDETIKLWGLTLTEYDRVLVIDADFMVLRPMDELMELKEDFIGTYDFGLDTPVSIMPPVQGGFLLFRPNQTDFKAIKELIREGSWDGQGWKQSGIGYCYGGVGPDGILAYYFNKDATEEISAMGKASLPEGSYAVRGSRMLAVNRKKYDVVDNVILQSEFADADQKKAVENVSSVHFTGDCPKPWICLTKASSEFCLGLIDKWWSIRASLEQERGLPPSKACHHGDVYSPIQLQQSMRSHSA